MPADQVEAVRQARSRTQVRIHQANVPDYARRPEDQAGFLTSLDRFAACLKSLAS